MDSTLMHINDLLDLPRPNSTLTRHQRGLISNILDYFDWQSSLDFFAKAQEARELIKNYELNLYV